MAILLTIAMLLFLWLMRGPGERFRWCGPGCPPPAPLWRGEERGWS